MRMYDAVELLEPRQLLTANLVADFGGIYPTDAVTVNGVSFFIANDGKHGKEICRSDGSLTGTRMLRDISPGSSDSIYEQLTPYKNGVAFFVRGADLQLWISDGTSARTIKLASIPANTLIKTLTAFNGKL